MGYTGKIDKNRRTRNVVVEEANRVVQTGLDMIQVIKEVRHQTEENNSINQLDMRIGIHTGKVVGGIIGSKVVRYDIFGEGVLIANKMESNGLPGKVCISEDTKLILESQLDVFQEYTLQNHNQIYLNSIGKMIKSYIIERAVEKDATGS